MPLLSLFFFTSFSVAEEEKVLAHRFSIYSVRCGGREQKKLETSTSTGNFGALTHEYACKYGCYNQVNFYLSAL